MQLQDVNLTLLKMKETINYTNFIPKLNKNYYLTQYIIDAVNKGCFDNKIYHTTGY